MANQSRIRWTAEEQSAVIAAATELAISGKKLTTSARLMKAQQVLPKNRRRPLNANLSSWLSKSVGGGKPIGASKSTTTERKTGAIATPSPSITQSMINVGVQILKGILADPGVQKALKQALK